MTESSNLGPAAPHPATLDIETLLRDCRCTRARRGGPGGQHRNKVETAFLIEHLPTGIAAEANERRSLEENRKAAVGRLRVRLAILVRGDASPSSSTSDLWRRRRVGGKIDVSESHEDFPAILAEALDQITTRQFQIAEAAKFLEVTTSSLVRLIARSTEAITFLNRERQNRGMPKLRVHP